MPTCTHCGRMTPDVDTRSWGSSLACASCHEVLAAGAAAPQSVPAGLPPVLGYAFPALYPPQGNSGLGIASLVLGITCLLVAWVPICGMIAWPLCLVGLILAIVDLCQKNRAHAFATAGLILSIMGFAAPFVCLLGMAIVGPKPPTPTSVVSPGSTTQSAPAAPASQPADAADVEK